MIARAAFVVLALSSAATAQDAGAAARTAAADLAEAARRLSAADGAGDRVAALTGVVRAYEAGLSALRDGLRQVTIRERAMDADLAAREGEVGRLLGVLAGMERAPAPLLLLHPSGALGTARSSMMLAQVAPALQAEADALRADLAALSELRMLEQAAADSLRDGLDGVQAARVALSDAMSDRTDLPAPMAGDDARIADLLGRADTLEAFASGLAGMVAAAAIPAAAALALPLPLPVTGVVLRRAGEADAAGIARPGLVLATAPGALVTAPTSGTVRYAGPLLDYANVIILEPRPDTMFVFAGVAMTYVRTGDIVAAAAPLGLMGGTQPGAGESMRDAAAGSGTSRTETLYVEIRESGQPVDPARWFAAE